MAETKRHRLTTLTADEVEQRKKMTKGEFKKEADELLATIKRFGTLQFKLGAGPGGKEKPFTEPLWISVPDPSDPTGRKTITQQQNFTVDDKYLKNVVIGIGAQLEEMVKNFAAAQDRSRKKKEAVAPGSYEDKKRQLSLGIRAIIEIDAKLADFLIGVIRDVRSRPDNQAQWGGRLPYFRAEAGPSAGTARAKNVTYVQEAGVFWSESDLAGLSGQLPGYQGRRITSTHTAHYILKLYAMQNNLFSISTYNQNLLKNPPAGVSEQEILEFEMKRDTFSLDQTLVNLLVDDPRTPGTPQPGNIWVVTTPPNKENQEERKARHPSERKSTRGGGPGELSAREKRLQNPTPQNFDQKQLIQIVHLFQINIGTPQLNGAKNFSYRKVAITSGPGVGQGYWLEPVLGKKGNNAQEQKQIDATKETRQAILANQQLVDLLYREMSFVVGYFSRWRADQNRTVKTRKAAYLKGRPKEAKETGRKRAATKASALTRIALPPPGQPIDWNNPDAYPLAQAAQAPARAAVAVNVPGVQAAGTLQIQPAAQQGAAVPSNVPVI